MDSLAIIALLMLISAAMLGTYIFIELWATQNMMLLTVVVAIIIAFVVILISIRASGYFNSGGKSNNRVLAALKSLNMKGITGGRRWKS